jgi:hypothetical protein
MATTARMPITNLVKSLSLMPRMTRRLGAGNERDERKGL